MKHAHNKTRHKRPRIVDESLNLPFNGAGDGESARDVAQQALEDVRRETANQEQLKPVGKVPDYVLDYLSDFNSIDHLPATLLHNVLNGLDETGQAYYFELIELMVGGDHNLSCDDAERTALKLALKHSRNYRNHEY